MFILKIKLAVRRVLITYKCSRFARTLILMIAFFLEKINKYAEIILNKLNKNLHQFANCFQKLKICNTNKNKLTTKDNFMKKAYLIIIAIVSLFFGVRVSNVYSLEEKSLYKFEGNIENFFTHQIINRPDLAFNEQNKYRYNFYRDCVTSVEFERFLFEMRKNNYILVDIYDCYGVKNSVPYKKELYIPKGKKPFILSFDDMSFDTKNKGMSDKLILDSQNNIASYTSHNERQIEYDKEAIPILENFLKYYPDFSFNGARGIICPTGYNGILGYRINKDNPNFEREKEKVKPLIKRLKELGYRFGSHTFNHICVSDVSYETLLRDTKRYNDEIIPVIGKTNILSFPCGKFTLNDGKLKVLKEYGFSIFLCVGKDKQENFEKDCLYLKRHVLDGGSMLKYRRQLLPIIDTTKIYDYDSRV